MTNNNIDLVLQRIQEDLEKLESARKQVLDVTTSGINITKVIISLTEKVGLVYGAIDSGAKSYTTGINDNLKILNDHILDLKKESDQSIAAFSTQLEMFTSSISLNIEESINSITSKVENIFQNQQDAIHKNLLDLSDLNSKILYLKEDISKIDLKTHLSFVEENIEKYSTKTTENIIDASQAIQELLKETIITNHDSQIQNNLLLQKQVIENNNELASSFQALVQKNNDDINSKLMHRISVLEKQAKMNSYITWSIVIIAAIAQFLL